MPDYLAGAGLRLAAVFLMTAMGALIHAVGPAVGLGQVMFWRSAAAILPILAYMAFTTGLRAGLRTTRPALHLTRGLLGALTMGLSFLSLQYLPVATASALAYLAPVLTLPLAAVLLHERLGPARLVAVLLGFAGALLVLLSAIEAPGQGALIGVLAGLGYALLMAFLRVFVKHMTRTESAALIALSFALCSALAGLALAPMGWSQPSGAELTMMVGAGLLGGIGHILSTEAVRRAPVSAIAPYDFTGLIWAAGIDLWVFGLIPAPVALVGMLAITAAALLVTGSEGRAYRAARG